MSFSTKYIPVKFSVWFAENVEDLKYQYSLLYKAPTGVEYCDECGGEGLVECDLGHDHDCEECDGTGIIDPNIALARYAEIEYDLQKKRDEQVVERFTKELESCQMQTS